MIKVRILDRCEFCDGEAYIYDYRDVDVHGEAYDRYRPCEMCKLKICWEGEGTLCPADGDHFIFDRLADYFQNSWTKFGQLVQE